MSFPSLMSLPSLFAITISLQFSLISLAQSPPNPESQTVQLWKGKPPGETVELPPEADTTKPDQPPTGGSRVIRIGNVSNPTLEIFRPDPAKFPMKGNLTTSQTAVIICPGGGHRILAYDLEGTEVARWLASQGITGIVLKYRVPARDPENKAQAAVQDAQRAIRWVRSEVKSLGISPDRIGIMGFSAGGEVAARATLLCDQDHYPKADAYTDPIDQLSAKPNFAALIYPAYLTSKDQSKLLDELKPSSTTPTMFLVHAWNDAVTPLSSLYLAAELKKANVPCELHMYSSGGHGYGLRHVDGVPVTDWPGPLGQWLKVSGWMEKKVVAD